MLFSGNSETLTRHLRSRALGTASIFALGLAGCLSFADAAHAQAAGGGDTSLETVVVTGSRISIPGFQSPTPVVSISGKNLEMLAPVSVAELENDLPSLEPVQNSFAAGGGGTSTFNLRGLGSTRTLFLVDGRRMPGTASDGTTDVTIIPTNLVKNISVTTGGASAAYGSDAVSGVVNVSLDDTYEGFKAQVQGGQSAYSDYRNYDGSAAWGMGFDGDRGHIVLSGDMYGNSGARNQGNRGWANNKVGLLTNPLYTTGSTTQTQLLIVPNTTFAQMTSGGMIDAPAGSPLRGITFGPNGTTSQFQFGSYVGTTFQVGGDQTNSFSPWVDLFPTETRQSGYGRASYDISDNVTAYVDVLYAREYSHMTIVPNYNNGNITITADNAYLPASVSAIMAANKITSFLLGRSNIDLGYDHGLGDNYSTTNTGRYAAGLTGKFDGGWTWNAAAQYGITLSDFRFGNSQNVGAWTQSLDAVVSPTTGQPVCRSNLTGGNPGCVPANPFGFGSVSPASQAWSLGTAWTNTQITQSDFTANLQGVPFQDWAGDVSFAGGGEYRHDTVGGTSDPGSVAKVWRLVNNAPLAGHDNVEEGYLEVGVPLLKDAPLAETMDLDLAGRITNYSTSGTVETWKIGLNYQPIDDLRLRGVWSHDIRAPNLSELYAAQAFGIFVVTDPVKNAQPTVHEVSGGNPNLVPEQANDITAGFVYTPSWIPGLETSIDYYRVNISGAIGSVAGQNVINNCYAGQTSFCNQITRDGSGNITAVFAALVNYSNLKTDGVDMEAAYTVPLSDISDNLDGNLSLHLVNTYVANLINIASGVSINYAGAVAGNATGIPHWRTNLTALYTNDPFTFQLLGRWVAGGKQASTDIQGAVSPIPAGYQTINNNQVDGRFYLDVSGSYDIGHGVTPFFRITNIFNTAPPLTPSTVIGDQQAASTYYDDIGRVSEIGVRFATN